MAAGFWDGFKEVAQSEEIAGQRPGVGKRVRVEVGRRRGAEGKVLRHVLDRFGSKWRYGSDLQHQLRDVAGRYGYRVQVETETHGTFWIDAEKVKVLQAAAEMAAEGER